MNSRRITDKALTIKREQNFSASHIFESTVWLNPVPFLTEDFRNICTAFVPMLKNDVLNKIEISRCDGSFSDGDGQHLNCITEKDLGRQQKMKKSKKIFWQGKFDRKSAKKWVESKNDGLKIVAILARWNY